MKLSGDPATFLLLCLNQPAAHAPERRFRQFALRDVDESNHGPNNLFSSQLRIGPIFGGETCSISPPKHLLFRVVSLPGLYYPVNSTFLHREQRSIRTSVKEWFRSYLDWLETSEKGKAERDTLNNHAMCWALQAAEFAHVLDDTATREEVFRQYMRILLPNQLGPDGSFPRELARTKPYSYSIFNFDVMTALCHSLKGLQPDPLAFRLADGRGVCKAAEFIYHYLKDKGKWKWAKDVQHFDSLPVRSPGLLFAGVACNRGEYIARWRTMNPDPTDREIIRNNPIRQPLLWV
jgi:hypothetical protein